MKDIEAPYPRCPDAAAFLVRQLQDFSQRNPAIALRDARFREAGVDILTVVDHWTLPETPDLVANLERWGFVEETRSEGAEHTWNHPLARLPRIRLSAEYERAGLALAV